MTEHTKTPWFLDGYMNVWANCIDPFEGGTSICKINRDEDRTSPTERDANAEFIVRAVNAHDDLLGIVKDILPEYHDDYADGRRCDECGTEKATPEQTQCDVPGCWYVRIREAIAKAEGTA